VPSPIYASRWMFVRCSTPWRLHLIHRADPRDELIAWRSY
jgi:hypothetical protein